MIDSTALPLVQLRLPCSSEREFQERFAERCAKSGVFVRTDRLRPVGSHVQLVIELVGCTASVRGKALVAQHGHFSGRAGMWLRFLQLDPESILLHPQGDVPAPPEPSLPARAPGQPGLEQVLFADQAPEDTASRPLVVQLHPVTLRVNPAGEDGGPDER